MKEKIILGCIADDFTGASDAASFLVKGGMKTLLFNGIPKEEEELEECQAVVIALKTRTQESLSAVNDTLQAAAWLKNNGAEQLYIKYCSTFDSTRTGNIGPILDALLENYDVPCTILCPALPVNGRTVKEGKLYVNGVPLHESPMKDHPLTPMWDSDIKNLMEAQSKYSCVKVSREEMMDGRLKKDQGKEKKHWYIIPDYVEDKDAEMIVKGYADLPVLSGGSGMLTELARYYITGEKTTADTRNGVSGAAILLAGSCSKATREQIAYYQKSGKPFMKIDPLKLLSGEQKEEELWTFVEGHAKEDVLIYSSDDPDAVKQIQKNGKEKVAGILEDLMAQLAKKAVYNGYKRIIVAGGETSGAVTKGLGFSSYIIGDSVAPGVPVMIPRNQKDTRLVLKSGNFGQKDFFLRALTMTGKDENNE